MLCSLKSVSDPSFPWELAKLNRLRAASDVVSAIEGVRDTGLDVSGENSLELSTCLMSILTLRKNGTLSCGRRDYGRQLCFEKTSHQAHYIRVECLHPRMLEEYQSRGPFSWVLDETVLQEVDQLRRDTFRQWRQVVLHDTEED